MTAYPTDGRGLVNRLGGAARPFVARSDLEPLLDAIGDARYVVLGGSTRGTAQFFASRAEITKRLIEDRGFSLVAVDGDWADITRLNDHVLDGARSNISAATVLQRFEHWPAAAWANHQVAAFAEWLRDHNRSRNPDDRVGIYGLDFLGLWDAIETVVDYLEWHRPAALPAARHAAERFAPHLGSWDAPMPLAPIECEHQLATMLRDRASQRIEDVILSGTFRDNDYAKAMPRDAERFHKALLAGTNEAWNLRELHLSETLDQLMTNGGRDAKSVVWVHNSHGGDARFANGLQRRGFTNVGQLVRETHGEGPSDRDGVFLVGFGTHRGTVLAATEWGEPMVRVPVPAAQYGSVEDLMHTAVNGDGLFLFDGSHNGGVRGFDEPLGHRAIGVVYDPRNEQLSHYVSSIIPRRYDAFVFLDETRAADPIGAAETLVASRAG